MLRQHHPCPGRGCPNLPCTDIRCCFPKNVSEFGILDSQDAECAVISEGAGVPGRQSNPSSSPAAAWATARVCPSSTAPHLLPHSWLPVVAMGLGLLREVGVGGACEHCWGRWTSHTVPWHWHCPCSLAVCPEWFGY